MNQKAIFVSIIIFVLIVVGMFTFAFLKKKEIALAPDINDVTEATTTDAYSNLTRIDAKHFYIDGVHTLVGEVSMPTPCDLVETTSQVAESYPEQVTISFNVINNSDSCAQIITAQRFKVSATASKDASFTATFMGRPVILNLVPAAPGENPDDFELFIKG